MVAGENCPHELIVEHYAVNQTTKLFDEYGPTENCVWTTVSELSKGNEAIHIGKTDSKR